MSENLPDNNQPVQPAQPVPPAQPAPAAPGVPAAPAYNAAPAAVPGKTLGIVGLILAFIMPLIGLILSIVAMVQSRKAGAKNIPALIGIIVGAIATIGWIIAIIAIIGLASAGIDAAQQCLDGATSVMVAGNEVLCSEINY
ncbi:DUF4190 domain-containing protein [Leucobacter viscericola]|uniref:DUF4190 domain-containing protein n=1 Tax=Leucobacter viscericola TaxID=2714935 RepID=A0A6G7XIE9_9MICO|nr:DUF4190 domain-containing protein [Leucobacter viscericola]QIK64256.1 DUF4190 domain-containing protein [Leucobacter viscericola]